MVELAGNAPDETVSERLGRFIQALSFEDIPAPITRLASLALLDGIGVAFAASKAEFARQVAKSLAALAEPGSSPVIGMGRFQQRDAAFLNGVLVHGLDFDDTHLRSAAHPTACLLPVVFAAAHRQRASGKAALEAYVAGLETIARLGIYGGIHLREIGQHTTSVLGVFGSAVAAGKLMGLSARELAVAQGIALSMASGKIGNAADGPSNKRLHAGWAAQSGLVAASLAQAGCTGPNAPYEGVQGLFKSMGRSVEDRQEALFATMSDLGTVWETGQIAVKPIPACHLTHACSDAAAMLSRTQDFDTAEIVRIEAVVPEAIIPVVCEPIDLKRAPQSSYAAQFSIPYVVAASLVRKCFGFAELDVGSLHDPEITRLARLVEYRIDPNTTYPKHRTGEIAVELRDGRTFSCREAINRGCPDRPLSETDIVEKFRANVEIAGFAGHADRIQHLVLSMASWTNSAAQIAVLADINSEIYEV